MHFKDAKTLLFAYMKLQTEHKKYIRRNIFYSWAFCPFCGEQLERVSFNFDMKNYSEEHYKSSSMVASCYNCQTCKDMRKPYTYTREEVLHLPFDEYYERLGYIRNLAGCGCEPKWILPK